MTENLIKKASQTAHRLYEGKETPHRSCGICLAETFSRATPAYQALRKGGLTGQGFCGAIQAGLLILGELLGDPSPTGAVTEELKSAVTIYTKHYERLINKGTATSFICQDLTSQFENFLSEERLQFCTAISANVAQAVAQTLIDLNRSDLLKKALK